MAIDDTRSLEGIFNRHRKVREVGARLSQAARTRHDSSGDKEAGRGEVSQPPVSNFLNPSHLLPMFGRRV